jgi:hypothetical protein
MDTKCMLAYIFVSMRAQDGAGCPADIRSARTETECRSGGRLLCADRNEVKTAKHEEVAIFQRKMSGFRMFSWILRARSAKKSMVGLFVGQLIK